jgi:cytochrome c553
VAAGLCVDSVEKASAAELNGESMSSIQERIAKVIFVAASGWCLQASAQISDEALARRISGYANDLCGSCHHSPAAGKELPPRIAGQQRAYIEAQLKVFQQKSRKEPEAYDCMWGLSSALSDVLVAALAGYFASQAPFAGIAGDPVLIDKGRAVFNRNGASEQMPSCAQCHGTHAEGNGTIPRLAGQLGPYLNRQMWAMQAQFRKSGVMHGVVQNLSNDEMYWLAVYLQSL